MERFELLLNRVGDLKKESIGNVMRIYIRKIIEENPELGDPQEISNKIKNLYGYRSTLLHQGKIDSRILMKVFNF